MKKIFPTHKIPIAFFIWCVCGVLSAVVSVIFFVSHRLFSNYVNESNIAYTTQVFNQMQGRIQEKSDFMEGLLQSVAFNPQTIDYILKDFHSDPFAGIKNLDTMSLNIQQIEPAVGQIFVEGFNGSEYCSSTREPSIMAAMEAMPEEPNYTYDFSHEITLRSHQGKYFLLSTSMYDIWERTSIYFLGRATFVINLDLLGVEDFKDSYGMQLYLVSREKEVFSSNQQPDEVVYEILRREGVLRPGTRKELEVGEKNYIVNCDRVSALDSYLVSVLPEENITRALSWMQSVTTLLLLSAIMLMIAILALLNYKITHPLYLLTRHMVGMQNETARYLKKEIHLTGYREIHQVSGEFNRMVGEIHSLTKQLLNTSSRLYETELQKKQAELLHLRSQINPHFLFNTLESITGMAYLENAEQTADMVKCLARIFKYSVKGEDEVLLQMELQVVRAYVHIQQLRFPELFTVDYSFEEGTLRCRLPKVLLQPLVENAITHGFEPMGSGGRLVIGGRMDEDQLVLWVEDNGVGFTAQKLEHFQRLIAGKEVTPTDSIGLENVISRLQLLYGNYCSIDIESKPEKGSRIEIQIPAIR